MIKTLPDPVRLLLGGGYLVSNLLLRLPFWILISILRSTRPSPGLTLLQSVYVLIVRFALNTITTFRIQPPQIKRAIKSKEGKPDLVLLPFVSEKDRSGVLIETKYKSALKNSPVPAFWFLNKKDQNTIGSRTLPVLIYLHGGAYISLEASDANSAPLTHKLAQVAEMDVLSVNYTLSPGAVFPNAMAEALSVYIHLLDNGYKSDQVFIGGDSAGANLALSLCRHLIMTNVRPLPRGLVLLSAWLDMTFSTPSVLGNAGRDTISLHYTSEGYKAYNNNTKATDPWMSPLFLDNNELGKFPPMYIVYGAAETLVDEGRLFVEKAQAAGVRIDSHFFNDMPHDFCTAPVFQKEAKEVYKQIKAWRQAL